MVHVFQRDEIEVVVVSGETNGYWLIFGANYGKAVSTSEWRLRQSNFLGLAMWRGRRRH